MTHYEALGVDPSATPAELREAFRRAARAAHPDRHGTSMAAQMAAVNAAWHVLGDPERRRQYDAELAAAEPARPSGQAVATAPAGQPCGPQIVHQPARFPWRFMAALASVGVALVAVGVIVYDPPPPRAPDGILRTGDCVMLTAGLEAVEVTCGAHDAVVERLIPFGHTCPADTEPRRDHQGMGTACVVRVVP